MRKLFPVLCFASVAAACGSQPQNTFEATKVSAIELRDERFLGYAPKALTRQIFCGRQDFVTWSVPAGRAGLLLVVAEPGCGVVEPFEDEDGLIKIWPWLNQGYLIFGGDPVMVEAPLGTIWVRQFERNDEHCFFLRHAFGGVPVDPHLVSDKFIAGYFCARSGSQMTKSDIESFVRAIRVP